MSDSNPSESFDAEGLPTVEDQPPGIDVETEQEGMIVPRDHPIAAGGAPGYSVTAAEERTRETVADRAAREIPEVDAGPPADTVDDVDDGDVDDDFPSDPARELEEGYIGAMSAGPGADLSGAVPVDEPFAGPDDTVTADTRTTGRALIEPESGDGVDADDEGDLVALTAEDDEVAASAEEAAMRVEDEDHVR